MTRTSSVRGKIKRSCSESELSRISIVSSISTWVYKNVIKIKFEKKSELKKITYK